MIGPSVPVNEIGSVDDFWYYTGPVLITALFFYSLGEACNQRFCSLRGLNQKFKFFCWENALFRWQAEHIGSQSLQPLDNLGNFLEKIVTFALFCK